MSTHRQQRQTMARVRHELAVAELRDGRRRRSTQFADKRDRLQARKPKHRGARGTHWS